MTETETTTDDPEPLTDLHFPQSGYYVRLFSDGEYVRMADGTVNCSEHGNILYDEESKAQCNHQCDEADVGPGFSIDSFKTMAAEEPSIQEEVIHGLSIDDPVRFQDLVIPHLVGMEFQIFDNGVDVTEDYRN